MKAKSILHLGLMLTGLLSSNLTFASFGADAPESLRYFVESDFDSIHIEALKTNAVPVKVLIPALILEGRSRGWIAADSFDYKEVFKRAGLFYPEKVIFNSKAYAWKNALLPVGLVQKGLGFGIGANVKFANLSCVACHSGSEYDQNGKKTGTQVIGAPSDSFNPEVYVTVLYQGMKKVNQDWKLATAIMDKVIPEGTFRERLLIQTFLRSQIKSYIKSHEVLDRGTPFINGGPGLTNGVASLKNVLGLDTSEGSGSGFTSIPSLGDRGFKTSLLYDGIYSNFNQEAFREVREVTDERIKDVTTIAALFTVPTMGQTPARAMKNIDNVVKLIGPILKDYKTAAFPGNINRETATRGFEIYKTNCLQCHGEYKWDGGKKSQLVSFPNKLIPEDDINSDPNRWLAVSDSLVLKMGQLSWNKTINVNQTHGYVAPILEGLWASAPYMHNGSVPSLWLFMRPEKRPKQFIVGNQSLDMQKVGIESKANLVSEIYDTSIVGRSNTGHESEFENLSETDKDDLLEYLKTL